MTEVDLDQCLTPRAFKRTLDGLSRPALQQWAKKNGIKANIKSDDIKRSLFEKLMGNAQPAREADGNGAAAEGSELAAGASEAALSPVQHASPARQAPTPPPDPLFGAVNPLFFMPDAAGGSGKPTSSSEQEEVAAAGAAEQAGGASNEPAVASEAPAAPQPAAEPAAAPQPAALAEAQQAGGPETALADAPAALAQGQQPQGQSDVAAQPRSAAKRRVSAMAGRRSSVATRRSSMAGHAAWQDKQAQKLQELQKNWSNVGPAAGKARTWKLPSAKDVKQTAAALASSGFTVVNSPGKNKPPTVAQAVGSKRKAEDGPAQGGPLSKSARSGPRLGTKPPTPSRLRTSSGPSRENAADNVRPAACKPASAKPAGTKPPNMPKGPLTGKSMAERAKAAEAAFTARRVAALQKVQAK